MKPKKIGRLNPLMLLPAVEDYLAPTKSWMPHFTKYHTGYGMLQDLGITWEEILDESALIPATLKPGVRTYLNSRSITGGITGPSVKMLIQYFKGQGYLNMQGWVANANRVVMSGHMTGKTPDIITSWLLYNSHTREYGPYTATEAEIETADGPKRIKYELGFMLRVPLRKQPYTRPVCTVEPGKDIWPAVIGQVSVALRINNLPDLAQYWRDKSMHTGRLHGIQNPMAVRALAHKYVNLVVKGV